MSFDFSSFDEAYPRIISEVLESGHIISPRPGSLGETIELMNFGFSIPADRPMCTLKERKAAYTFVMIEPLLLFSPQNDNTVGALCTYAPALKKLALNQKTGRFDSNYGDLINLYGQGNQLHRVYDLLHADPQSRRGVITIHNPCFLSVASDSADVACSLSLCFYIRDGQLDCYCTMRSNDAILGTIHNIFQFTFIQRALAGWLGVKAGRYYHRAYSFHIYTEHLEWARRIVDNPERREDIPAHITYPMHSSPSETFHAVEKLVEWEKSVREEGAYTHEFTDEFEKMFANRMLVSNKTK